MSSFLQLGLSLSASRAEQINRFSIVGSGYIGSTLTYADTGGMIFLLDDGLQLYDDGLKIADGIIDGYYQWRINGIDVPGANTYTFVIPETANDGDVISLNNSYLIKVTSLPFEVISTNYTQTDRLVSSNNGTSNVTILDTHISRTIQSNVVSDFQFSSVVQGFQSSDNWIFTSSNEAVAVVDQSSGYVTYVSNGSSTITASLRDYSHEFQLSFTSGSEETYDEFISYVSGSAAENATSAIDNRIATKFNAATNLKLFTSQDHTNQIYVRNGNVWCSDLNLTCISVWNSTGGATRAGTLISPRHIIFAAHYEINVGATVRFVTMNGTVVNRTMTAKMRHPDYNPHYPDLTIGVLDSDVPNTIGFAKILPADWENYFPSLDNQTYALPSVGLDQEEKATIQDLYALGTMVSSKRPIDSKRLALYEDKITGDSGNPMFIIINDEPVILTVWTYGGSGSGTSIAYHKNTINSIMTTLGGGYQLTEADLSNYNSYT